MTVDLASELRLGIATQEDLPLQASVAWGLEFWESCCGERQGDTELIVTDQAGEIIGPDHGVIVEIADEIFIPRRLGDSMNLRVGLETYLLPNWSLGLHSSYRTLSVPDYAMNALQQDFNTVEIGLHSALRLSESLRLGASYTHRVSAARSVSNSAWDVHIITANDVPEDYVDERFSPQLPFTVSGNADYSHRASLLALRLEIRL